MSPRRGTEELDPNAPAPDAPGPDAPAPDAPADGNPLVVTDRAELARLLAMHTEAERAEEIAKLDEAGRKLVESIKPEEIEEAKLVLEIEGFSQTSTETPGDFRDATKPVRTRRPRQLAMDAVATKAYQDWVDGDRQTLWQKMPVITYFLEPDEVKDWESLIRSAVKEVTPQSFQHEGNDIMPTGVRARFGKTFVLSEKMAAKIGKPDKAGKTVLAWAAIDKRGGRANGDTDE